MSTQTHSLALQINAEAAKAGSRVFVSAIAAVKAAVQNLDKQADGTFSKLSRLSPQYDVTPLKRATSEAQKLGTVISGAGNASDRAANDVRKLALQSANALRVSTDQASRLRDRLLSVGDNTGLAQLDAGLSRLRTNLINATSGLNVREARAGYADLASELNRTAREAERLRAIANAETRAIEEAARSAAAYSSQLEALALKYNPLRANSLAYAASLEEIATAERAGAISAQLAAQARDQAAARLAGNTSAMNGFTVSAGQARAATQQMGYQINDIATMAMMSASPLQVVSSQIFQVSQAMEMAGGKSAALGSVKTALMGLLSPSTLAIGAVIGLTTVLIQAGMAAFGTAEDTKTFSESLSDADSKISAISRSTATLAGAKLGSLAEGYGRVNAELKIHLERLSQIATLEAMASNRANITALEDEVTGGWLTNDIDDFRRAMGSTSDAARHFMGLLQQIKSAKTFEDQATAITTARKYLESIGITLDKAEGSALALLSGLVKAEDSALQLLHAADESASAIAGATSQTAAWANMMASVKMQIDAIASSLSAIGGGAISAASKRVEIEALSRGETLRGAEIARIRHDNELKLGARTQAANARGGIAGWAESQLIDMERFALEENIKLDDQLNAQREAARKRETSTAKGGGGRVEALGDESRQLSKISKQLNDRIFGLNRENEALNLLIEGKARTKEGAEAMSLALALNNGVLDAATEATVRAYEANVLLNEQLQRDAKDPFRDYIQGLPSALEATKQLKTEMAQVLEGGINDLFMGEFDTKKLVDGLRRSLAQMLAQRSMKMLFGNMFDSSGIELASASGARQMSAGIVMGSQQGAAMFAAALSGAAIPAAGGGGLGGGLGLIGGLFSLFGFAEGGYSDRPGMSVHHVSPAAFNNAPHYKDGTSNTSGIPAVLHPNEAVVPLTKGRKIPVDASGLETGGGSSAPHFTMGDVHVEIKTEKSIEDPATAAKAAKNVADMIKQQVAMQMAEAAQYGGLMNPRGS